MVVVGTPGPPWGRTFVLADLLNPGQRVHLHQRVRDADHVHHVHDTLKARTRMDVTLHGVGLVHQGGLSAG